MLTIENIEVTYHHTVQALRGLSLEVPDGKIVTLLGTNGAGKTTTLKAASNLLALENGEVGEGRINFKGQSIMTIQPDRLVQQGLFHVREGRRIFSEMTVEDNLIAASYALDRRQAKPDYDKVYAFFPRLKERRRQIAGYLSGGEQQMLAFGRAMIARPELILMDEPSLGLSPIMCIEIAKIIKALHGEGRTIVLVEQNARLALALADKGYVLETGEVVLQGDAKDLRTNDQVQHTYLGITPDA